MRRLIWKLVINPYITEYDLPADATFIKVDWQKNDVCIWYKFESRPDGQPLLSNRKRRIVAVPTGLPFDDESTMVYVGTAVRNSLVFHVYAS